MKQGLGLMGLAAALVFISVLMGGSSSESIAGNAGPTALAACVCAVVAVVMIARSLMSD